uniref:Uncharacterized protein n=1 Tax=Zea mays TaxID=4577 RepID=C0HGA9_MAIZE|nr:unknown [Zea mays]
MAIKPSSIVILELPAVKIAWLDSGALACSACQRADALAVDTLRFFSLACTKYYSNNALSTAKPAYLWKINRFSSIFRTIGHCLEKKKRRCIVTRQYCMHFVQHTTMPSPLSISIMASCLIRRST